MRKLKLFLVAMVATAMVISSCKKEDENNEPETPTTPTETNKNTETIVVTAPEVIYPKQYQYVGLATTIDFKWEKPAVKKVSHIYDENTKSYNDTETELTDCSFKYELCYSTDGTTFETSDKLTETEFSKNVSLEKGQTYYYKINTYISYGSTKDSLIQKYDYKFSDDVTIPFYSTYEQKHHIGYFNTKKAGLLVWDKGCDCKLTWCEVKISDNGKYIYDEYRTETLSPANEGQIEMGMIEINGENVIRFIVFEGIRAVKYELTGKYNEKGTLHLLNDVDGSQKIYDGDFNVYDKKQFMNTDKQCVVFPKNAKNIYLEPMFEYAASGRIKRYNPNTYQGKVVTYEDWKEFSKGTSDMNFMINYQRLLGQTEENTTFPFLKNGEFVCYDKDFNGVDYESRSFDKNCGLIEIMDNYEDFKNKYSGIWKD